mgnify:CR=1 FL=1
MTQPGSAYSLEKRHEVLNEHYTSGRSINASADFHGINRDTLKRWIAKDDSWREEEPEIDIENGYWALCPRRRIQVWHAA